MNWKLKTLNVSSLWWLSLLVILFFFHSNHPLNSDEGVILEGAWNLINGKQLYYDFFEFIPPASFYLIYWAWLSFGISYFVAKFLSLLLIFFSSIFIFKISNQLTSSKFNYFPPFLFLISSFAWPVINHNVFNLFFIITASYFFIKGLNGGGDNLKNFLISGLLAGLSTLFLQQKGMVILGIFLSFLLILTVKQKTILWLKHSLVLPVSFLLPLTLLIIKWPAKLLYQNLIIFPSINYLAVNKVPLFLFLLYLIILLINIFLLKSKWSIKLWFLFYLQFILLLTTLARPDYFHLTLLIFPLYALIPLLLQQASHDYIFKYYSGIIIAVYSLIIIVPVTISLYFFPPFSSIDKLPTLNFIKNNCNQSSYIYAGPFNPGLYFETRKLNPTPYSFLITNHHTPEQFEQAKKYLEKNLPACAILNYVTVEKFNYNKNNPVDNFIFSNYNFVLRSGNNLIYKIKTN